MYEYIGAMCKLLLYSDLEIKRKNRAPVKYCKHFVNMGKRKSCFTFTAKNLVYCLECYLPVYGYISGISNYYLID